MERTEAVTLVSDTIAQYRGVTHLRFQTRGSFAGTRRVEITTLGNPRCRLRPRGTQEQQYVATEPTRGSGLWTQALQVLDPGLLLATGCAQTTGFDVDAEGNLTRRYGTRGGLERQLRDLRRERPDAASEEKKPRPVPIDLDGVLADHTNRVRVHSDADPRNGTGLWIVDYLPLMR